MKKLVNLIAAVFFLIIPCLILLAEPIHASPPSPLEPAITISVNSVDSESVSFHVEVLARNHELSYFDIKYRVGGNADVLTKRVRLLKPPGGVYPANHDVIAGDLPPDTEIHFWAELVYLEGSEPKTTATAEAATRTDPLPTITVSNIYVYCEVISLTIHINPNGHFVNDILVPYSTPADGTRTIIKDCEPGTSDYYITIDGLSSQMQVTIGFILNYQTNVANRSVEALHQTLTTNALPAITATWQKIGFENADILVEIRRNDNNIYNSGLTWQFPEISENWQFYSNPDIDQTFLVLLTSLSPGTAIKYRGSLSYATGDESIYDFIETETLTFRTNSISTGNPLAIYHSKSNIDFELRGDFFYTKRLPSEYTHSDLGFIWSEKPNPVINGSTHRISLSGISLPVAATGSIYTFNSTITGLKTGVYYYCRAYVIGENDQVYYGEEKPCFLPTSTPAPASSDATTNTATGSSASTETSLETGAASTTESGETSAPGQTTTPAESTPGSSGTGTSVSSSSAGSQSTTTAKDSKTGGSSFISDNIQVIVIILGAMVLVLAGVVIMLLLRRAKK